MGWYSAHKIMSRWRKNFGLHRQYIQRWPWLKFRWAELGSGAAPDHAAVEFYFGLGEPCRTSPHSAKSVTVKFSPILQPYTSAYRDGVRPATTERSVGARGTTYGVGMGVSPKVNMCNIPENRIKKISIIFTITHSVPRWSTHHDAGTHHDAVSEWYQMYITKI